MRARRLATEIVNTLVDAGYMAYFAGGWVRDYLLGHPSADVDIATSATPQEIAKIFPKTVPVGAAFGVMIVLKEGMPFEVATFRKDIEYLDGRKPSKIEMSTPLEDAQRRDFTINGMFYDPLKDEVIDLVGGKDDLARRLVRAIGNPDERFVEDRLRMIRAVRIASRFDFKIDPETEEAIKKNAHTLFPAVAMERIWQELKKMGEGKHFDRCIIDLHRFGLLQQIFTSLKHKPLHEIQACTAFFAKFPQDCPTILYIMELFPNAPLERFLEICFYLKVSAKDMELVEFMDRGKKITDPVHWVYFYADPRSQLILQAIAAHEPSSFLHHHHNQRKKLEQHIDRIIHKTPLVSAKLLQEEGILPGKQMGALIKEGERIAITQDLHDPQKIIAKLKQSTFWNP